MRATRLRWGVGRNFQCLFYRFDVLEADLAVLQPTDPAHNKFIRLIKHIDLLVIGDFLTNPITEATASVVLNVLSGRKGNSFTLITSKIDPADCYKSIAGAVLAESIPSRSIGQAQIIYIETALDYTVVCIDGIDINHAPIHIAREIGGHVKFWVTNPC
ncbi:MAG TPA: hypothetical protein DIS84_01990 [Corynebacterium stationis]|nr:hypothetical protein [Corynebacterium stationis]